MKSSHQNEKIELARESLGIQPTAAVPNIALVFHQGGQAIESRSKSSSRSQDSQDEVLTIVGRTIDRIRRQRYGVPDVEHRDRNVQVTVGFIKA